LAKVRAALPPATRITTPETGAVGKRVRGSLPRGAKAGKSAWAAQEASCNSGDANGEAFGDGDEEHVEPGEEMMNAVMVC
jgi:hypothetical protein